MTDVKFSVLLMWSSEGFLTFPSFYIYYSKETTQYSAELKAKTEAFHAQEPAWRKGRHVDGWKVVATMPGKVNFWIGEAWADLPPNKGD